MISPQKAFIIKRNLIIFSIVFVLLCIFTPLPKLLLLRSEIIHIKDKDVKRIDDVDYYLIFSDNEVFKNTDDWFFFKFDSADLYGNIDIDKTYKVRVTGLRIPILSYYRNIISAKPTQTPKD